LYLCIRNKDKKKLKNKNDMKHIIENIKRIFSKKVESIQVETRIYMSGETLPYGEDTIEEVEYKML
jgi:hypothetical protein